MLRILLAKELQIQPLKVELHTSTGGKPYVPGSDLEFNISHSGDYIVIALARGLRLGVDVEEINLQMEINSIIHRYFHPEEKEELSQLDPNCRRSAFFRYWTRKEAYLKGLGEGLAVSLESVNVGERATISPWVLYDLALAPGYAGALAWLGTPTSVTEILVESPAAALAHST